MVEDGSFVEDELHRKLFVGRLMLWRRRSVRIREIECVMLLSGGRLLE